MVHFRLLNESTSRMTAQLLQWVAFIHSAAHGVYMQLKLLRGNLDKEWQFNVLL